MRLPLLLSAALVVVLPAIANEDLERLRTGWKDARARVLEPVDRKYLAALEALKERLTREGKLEDAVTVGKEIENLPAAEGVLHPASGTVWRWHKGEYLFLRDDGRAHLYGAFPQVATGKWQASSPKKITITFHSPEPTREYQLHFGEELTSARVSSSSGVFNISLQ